MRIRLLPTIGTVLTGANRVPLFKYKHRGIEYDAAPAETVLQQGRAG